MIVEKTSRFFRLYDISTKPRHQKGASLPLIGDDSLCNLFQDAINTKSASAVQSNGDTVELIKAEPIENGNYLALLFHRANKDAPDPTYRRKKQDSFSLRIAERKDGEEQSFSAHLIIDTKPRKEGVYRCALEEIPGLSASAVIGILRSIASQTLYECTDDRNNSLETYTVIKCDGFSSETLEGSLKTGKISKLHLSRPPEKALEQDGAYAPSRQKVQLKVSEPINSQNYQRRFKEIFGISKKNGYDDVKVVIEFPDKRSRTISIDRETEAAEVLMVRSKLFNFNEDLSLCYVEVHEPIAKAAIKYISEN